MEEQDIALLCELFEGTPRQGPGSEATTRRALACLPDGFQPQSILDLGCGTGGSTLVLAEQTAAHITALDMHQPFLDTLRQDAQARGFLERITIVCGDMAQLEDVGDSFDLLWAEGSAYSIGFANALSLWRAKLRAGGCLFVSELAWFSSEPAEKARAFFAAEYPDMEDEAALRECVEDLGYRVLESFPLPAEDWQAFYAGLEPSLRRCRERHGEHSVFTSTDQERQIYEEFGSDYGYLCLMLQWP